MCTALIAKKSHGKGSILHTSLLRTLMLKLEDLLIPYTYLYSVYTYIYIYFKGVYILISYLAHDTK